jgi:hypothetical protein
LSFEVDSFFIGGLFPGPLCFGVAYFSSEVFFLAPYILGLSLFSSEVFFLAPYVLGLPLSLTPGAPRQKAMHDPPSGFRPKITEAPLGPASSNRSISGQSSRRLTLDDPLGAAPHLCHYVSHPWKKKATNHMNCMKFQPSPLDPITLQA